MERALRVRRRTGAGLPTDSTPLMFGIAVGLVPTSQSRFVETGGWPNPSEDWVRPSWEIYEDGIAPDE